MTIVSVRIDEDCMLVNSTYKGYSPSQSLSSMFT